jgi:hypothetical protein
VMESGWVIFYFSEIAHIIYMHIRFNTFLKNSQILELLRENPKFGLTLGHRSVHCVSARKLL